MSRIWTLALLGGVAGIAAGCGGGGGGGSYSPPPPQSYTIGGTVTGQSGSGLVLQDNGGDNLTVSGSAFTFPTAIAAGGAYKVTVLTQPTNPAQTCTVNSGSGTVGNANVTNVVVACTGGSPSPNVATVTVDQGPSGLNNPDVNTLFVTVTVCAPGSTTTCQTIDHIQVDTASFGLRLMNSALNGLALPQVKETVSGNALLECAQFADGYSWGTVRMADVILGDTASEKAAGISVQVIGDPAYTTVPPQCSSGLTQEDSVATFGANGILGIGPLVQDCPGCATSAGVNYWTCASASTCVSSKVALAQQVSNPITSFAGLDTNGSVIQLPAVVGGVAKVTGSLFFGIGTQGNNALTTQTVLPMPTGTQNVNTVFSTCSSAQTTCTNSFIDTGSNGLFFPDTTPAITACTSSTGFYCPGSTLSYSGVKISGNTSASVAVNFSIGNADALYNANPTFAAFSNIGGPSGDSNTFDWGLPFFYGRTVFIAISGKNTSAGMGPYYAF